MNRFALEVRKKRVIHYTIERGYGGVSSHKYYGRGTPTLSMAADLFTEMEVYCLRVTKILVSHRTYKFILENWDPQIVARNDKEDLFLWGVPISVCEDIPECAMVAMPIRRENHKARAIYWEVRQYPSEIIKDFETKEKKTSILEDFKRVVVASLQISLSS